MARTVSITLVFVFASWGYSYGQDVYVPRETASGPIVITSPEKEKAMRCSPIVQLAPVPEPMQIAKALPVKEPSPNVAIVKEAAPNAIVPKAQGVKTQSAIAQAMKTQPLKVALVKAQPPLSTSITEAPPPSPSSPAMGGTVETAFTKLADGFDFPVGKPDAQGYYKARGFRSKGHLGEDWDGVGGGDTDLGDPIYSIGDGIVVFARDCHMGWGNVIIVRHVFRDGGAIRNIDSLYGHLQKILVHRGQAVKRGQQIATLGNAHGLYDAHLHLEIRKNIEIGMSRAAFARDFNNYCDPSQFIASHRVLPKSYGSFRVAMDTFRHDEKIRWDKVRRYSGHRGGSGSESAVALKKALASQGAGTQ